MMNSNQTRLKKCNDTIRSLKEQLKKVASKPNKTSHDLSILVDISSKINYFMGYRAAIREVMGISDKEDNEGVENEEQKKALNIPLKNS